MKNIIKRADGRWMGRKTLDGKRFCVYAKTQAECLNKWRALKKPPKEKQNKSMSFYSFAEWYLKTYKEGKVAADNYNNYKNAITNHLCIKTSLSNLTVDELQKTINAIPATRIRELVYMVLKQILKKAFQLGKTKNDLGLFLEKGKIERNTRNAISYPEQKILMQHLDLSGKNAFSLNVLTYLLIGCRPAEINDISISSANKGFVFVDGTKTNNAKRWVKVSAAYAEILKNSGIKKFNVQRQPFGKVFVKFCKKIGICQYSLYSLRHTYSTNLYYLGVPDKERASYMGHASTVLTNDTYTDFDPTIKRDDVIEIYQNLYPF